MHLDRHFLCANFGILVYDTTLGFVLTNTLGPWNCNPLVIWIHVVKRLVILF